MISRIGSRFTTLRLGRAVAMLASLSVTLAVSTARADEPTDYCEKVTARAEGDAALLFAPTLHAEVIRYPNAGVPVDASGLQVGTGVQPRASVSFGLIDAYRGFGVLDVARKECRRQQSATTLAEVVVQAADIGRLPALERKLAFLREHRSTIDEVVRNAEERLAAQTTTLAEVQELRLRVLQLERGTIAIEREIAVLKARRAPTAMQPLAELLRAYEQRSVDAEKSVSHVRSLAPWKLNVTAGVTGSPSVDAYGVAELSYNLGGLFQHEGRAVQARANELRNGRYEMRQQIERISHELKASADQSRAEARAIGAELERMTRDRAALEGTDAPNKRALIATMTLSMLDLEAEQAFLNALADKQTAFDGAR